MESAGERHGASGPEPAPIAAAAMEQMRKRYSCRSYSDRQVGEELLSEILRTGMCAASGGNLQPWSVITVRKQETKDILARECGQKFIAKAPVDLVFLLDWSKLKHYAEGQTAPFVAHRAFCHNLIAFADVICAAQMMETAAQLAGLGCCFIGNILGRAQPLRPVFKFPEYSYPVLLLCLGYPSWEQQEQDEEGEEKEQAACMKKLPFEAMVFQETYAADFQRTDRAFEEKYRGMGLRLPSADPYRSQMLSQIGQALLTVWPEVAAAAAVGEIAAGGRMNEMQRRFCLQYRANEAEKNSEDLKGDMRSLRIEF